MNDEQNILNAIDRLDAQLSPENLYCDGEITPAQAVGKAQRIKRERAELERQLGRKVPYNG